MTEDLLWGELPWLKALSGWPLEPLRPGHPAWEALLSPVYLEALIRLDLAGTLYFQVANPSDLPDPVHNALKRRVLRQAARDAVLQAAETWSLEALNRHGVPTIPIKGLDFARALQTQAGERPTKDVDLLCQPNLFEKGLEALIGEGAFHLKRYPFEAPVSQVHDVALIIPGKKIVVELHHHFLDTLSLSHAGEDPKGTMMEAFWRRYVPGGELSAEGRWLIAAIRWHREGFHRGLALRDLVCLSAGPDWKFSDTLSFAQEHGLLRPITIATEITNHLLQHGPLSEVTVQVLKLTRPKAGAPRPQPGRRVIWATRPPTSKGLVLRRAIWPSSMQLQLSLKRPITNPVSHAFALLQWWLSRKKSRP